MGAGRLNSVTLELLASADEEDDEDDEDDDEEDEDDESFSW